MFTRSTRSLLILVIGIVLVLNSFAATGVALTEPADEHVTQASYETEVIESTSNALEHSSLSSTLSVACSQATGIIFLAGHNYSDGSDPLEHDLRQEIHDEIHQASGTYVSDLLESYDVHRSTLRYHLDVLEREDLISSETIFGQRWYYPDGSDIKELRAALTNDTTREIIVGIARLEPVNVTNLAVEVERAPSTVSYHLDRLEDEGLVEQERRGATVFSRLAPGVHHEHGTPKDPSDSE